MRPSLTTGQPEAAERSGSVIAEQLTDLLPRVLDCNQVDIQVFQRVPGGASRETWTIDASLGRTRRLRRLVLQRQRPFAVSMGMDVVHEAEVIRAAGDAGVPVPTVIAAGTDSALLGAPFLIFERVEGEAVPTRILRSEGLADARAVLATQYGEALGRLQQVSWRELAGLSAEDPLERSSRDLQEVSQPHPILELAQSWLREHRPDTSHEPVLVHGDYRNGNAIIGPEGLRAVVDWELAHVGDPLEDLAWFCIRAWRYGNPKPAGGLGQYDEFLTAYEGASGIPVDLDAFRWWIILGTFRWAVVCLIEGSTHRSGVRPSIELAAVGRRVAEAEYDLMLLLP